MIDTPLKPESTFYNDFLIEVRKVYPDAYFDEAGGIAIPAGDAVQSIGLKRIYTGYCNTRDFIQILSLFLQVIQCDMYKEEGVIDSSHPKFAVLDKFFKVTSDAVYSKSNL